MKTLKGILARRTRNSAIESRSYMPDHIRKLKSGLVLLLSRVESILDGTPFKIPISVVNAVVDLAQSVSDNNDDMRALLQEVSHQLEIVNSVLPDTSTSEGKDRILKFSGFLQTELNVIQTLTKRSSLKRILESDEDIKTIDAAMRRIDTRLRSFHLDITMSIERKVDNSSVSLRILYGASATDATHDSAHSYTHPPCHPNTRMEILDRLSKWSQDNSSSQILWMHGPAGTGKSAIAQSFCEQLQSRNRLAGSFFFKRGHPSREDFTKLWPTIAYQLALISHSFKAALAMRLTADPALVDKSLSIQMQKLIIEPYNGSGDSLIIVIDGLDECEDESQQQELLRSIARSLPAQPLLRILVSSRPEAHIKDVFDGPVLQFCERLDVHGSFDDVSIYLIDEFKRISETHAAMAGISYPWPSDKQIQYVLDKSSGHFIYAATVIRFVEDQDFDPMKRLELIYRPFAALDKLYHHILTMVPYRSQLSRVLAVIMAGLTDRLNVEDIGQLLGLKPTEVLLTLRRLHSLIKIEDNHVAKRRLGADFYILVYHASFLDFLRDSTRSRNFHFSAVDRQNLAIDLLKCWAEPDIRLGYLLVSSLLFIITTRLTQEMCSLLGSFRLEYALSGVFPANTDHVLTWLKMEEAPVDLFQTWEEICFAAKFNAECIRSVPSSLTDEVADSEMHTLDYIRSITSPELIRMMHMYRLFSLPFLEHGTAIECMDGARMVFKAYGLSGKDARTAICALRNEFGESVPWRRLFRSISYPPRIRDLHPDPSLEIVVRWCLEELPRQRNVWILPAWSCVLRSCPPSPELLQTLRNSQAYLTAYISREMIFWDYGAPSENHHWHNILQWLQTFPDPPSDMIQHVRDQLPADSVENEELWMSWKEFTGW
ncbi:NACHT domain-containing protein [Favolaschia claudopus]|uniref:NACHT domain-containing protein n=1 Tax=Favolaschia claudopus TaxID=2862362 RepID=A0AAV9ZMD4_9AGAR